MCRRPQACVGDGKAIEADVGDQPSFGRGKGYGGLVSAARGLALAMFLLLAAMPFTEHFWIFDNFCGGGQDFEFSLLAIAVTLGLVLLLSLHRKGGLMLVLLIQNMGFLIRSSEPQQFQLEGSMRLLSESVDDIPHSFAPGARL